MAAVPRSSPARGAPRCSPLGKNARPTTSPDAAPKASRSLVFQPQLLDSSSQDERLSHSSKPSQTKKSMIPSPSKLKKQPFHHPGCSTTADQEDSASSTMSNLSMDDVSSVSKPVLREKDNLRNINAACEGLPLGPATLNQVFEGSMPSDKTMMLLSSIIDGLLADGFSMGGIDLDLKRLITSPAFVKAVKAHTGCTSSSRKQTHTMPSLRPFAAVATVILSCGLIGLSLLQQQWSASWGFPVPV